MARLCLLNSRSHPHPADHDVSGERLRALMPRIRCFFATFCRPAFECSAYFPYIRVIGEECCLVVVFFEEDGSIAKNFAYHVHDPASGVGLLIFEIVYTY